MKCEPTPHLRSSAWTQHPLPCSALWRRIGSPLLTSHGIQRRWIPRAQIATYFSLLKKERERERQRDLASWQHEGERRRRCFKETGAIGEQSQIDSQPLLGIFAGAFSPSLACCLCICFSLFSTAAACMPEILQPACIRFI